MTALHREGRLEEILWVCGEMVAHPEPIIGARASSFRILALSFSLLDS